MSVHARVHAMATVFMLRLFPHALFFAFIIVPAFSSIVSHPKAMLVLISSSAFSPIHTSQQRHGTAVDLSIHPLSPLEYLIHRQSVLWNLDCSLGRL